MLRKKPGKECQPMKLSMWTICAWLNERGLEAEPTISDGLPRITSFRLSRENSYSATCVDVIQQGKHVKLINDMDCIMVRNSKIDATSNLLSEAFEYYTHWENLLYERMVAGASLQELLDTADIVFNRPMFIKNDSSWIFAITWGYPPDVHPYWEKMERSVGQYTPDYDTVRTVSTDPEFRNVFMEKYPSITRSPAYGAMILHANIYLEERRVAEIIALENGVPFDRGEVHLMHVFADMIERYIRSNAGILFAVSDPATFLGPIIETGSVDEINLPTIYRAAGLASGSELCVAVIEGKNHSDTPMLGVLRDGLRAQLKKASVFSYLNQVVCVMELGATRSYERALQQISAQVPVDAFVWGVSYEFSDLRLLRYYYEQAVTALNKATEKGRVWISMYDVACECILEKCMQNSALAPMIHPDLMRLRLADELDNTQYCSTLYYYLLCGGNYTDTAALMGLHRNSLIYRMNKIRGIMRTNPDKIENRELLILSYLLLGKK